MIYLVIVQCRVEDDTPHLVTRPNVKVVIYSHVLDIDNVIVTAG